MSHERMKPKLKNYRWWILLLPLLLAISIVRILTLISVALSFIAGVLDAERWSSRLWFKSLVDWSNSNDKN